MHAADARDPESVCRELVIAQQPGAALTCYAALASDPALPVEGRERARAQAVLRRTSSAADIAEQIVTCCRADSVTGQVVVIDGGAFFH